MSNTDESIQPIGNHWYRLYDGGSSIEYNTTDQPTATLHAGRRPQAVVYRHIDGAKVVAKITGRDEVAFMYSKSSYEAAYELAKEFVEIEMANQQVDIFN